MHVLVTGHTGFKGAWLTLLLRAHGHDVSGIALDPEPGSLFERADLSSLLTSDVRCDIRNAPQLRGHVTRISPDAVVHLAAQPLVLASYANPRETFETNVMGTLAVMEAVQETPTVRAALMVTTDKVYRNVGQHMGYVENDALGGEDPYSASKAMADILISSWTSSFPGCPTAIARAGNVIGGGDISSDRLIPDLIRAFKANDTVVLRYPEAVRPWQHVLDCLSGYLMLLDALPDGRGAGAWNFGPEANAFRTVRDTTELAIKLWPGANDWVIAKEDHPHEAHLLTLDSRRAHEELGWHERLDFEQSVEWTIDWERRVRDGENARDVTLEQITAFDSLSSVLQ